MASNPIPSVTPPRATIIVLAQAGGCRQENLSSNAEVSAKANEALRNKGQPWSWSEIAPPLRRVTKCQAANPEAIPIQCPRMTLRGAAAGENGALNRMNAVGPSAVKTRGAPLSQANRLMTK